MADSEKTNITALLLAWGKGDRGALEELTPRVQDELRHLAGHYMAGERQGHLLQTTALVNEAYMKLVDWKGVRWADRAHFFAIAASMMRRVLVDYARSNGRAKRGLNKAPLSLSEVDCASMQKSTDLVALDHALHDLERLAPRQSRVVELRYFGGLSLDEIAGIINVSVGTVRRDWSLARAWLFRELSRKSNP